MILEEAKVEPIATVMRRRRLEWFGHVKRRDETENIRAVVELKMVEKSSRGRPQLRWYDTVRRDLKAWKSMRNGPLTEKGERSLQDPLPRAGRRRRKVRKHYHGMT